MYSLLTHERIAMYVTNASSLQLRCDGCIYECCCGKEGRCIILTNALYFLTSFRNSFRRRKDIALILLGADCPHAHAACEHMHIAVA